MGEKMSKEKLIELDKRINRLEKILKEFMDNWGPEVQRRRDERDEVWDEMVRVVSIQKKHRQPEPGYDIHLSLIHI